MWGKPTCVNNVETLCNVPAILAHGKEWYIGLSEGKSTDAGTKLMGFSGRVKNPVSGNCRSAPPPVKSSRITPGHARRTDLKSRQPGGAGTDFLTQDHLDLPMDFEHIGKAGSRLGTALAMAVDNEINMVSLTRNLEEFLPANPAAGVHRAVTDCRGA